MKKLIIVLIFLFCYSLNSGDWRKVISFEDGWVNDLNCPDSNNCFALVQYTFYSRLYKSTNQGLTWDMIYQSDPYNEEKPFLFNAQIGVSPHPDYYFMVMTDRPIIKKSTDGGKTYRRIFLDTLDYQFNRIIYTMAMFDTNNGVAKSEDWFYVTKDGWETIEKISGLDTLSIYSPVFLNDSIVVMSASDNDDSTGVLFIKYNTKKNEWSYLFEFRREQVTNFAHIIYDIFFINDSIGFGCGYVKTGMNEQKYDLIYKTTDGGYNWKISLKQIVNPPFGVLDISFFDAKNGVAVGNWGKIWTTNDGGVTWLHNETPKDMTDGVTLKVAWSGQHPIIGTFDHGELFRYEGDFFDFTPDTTDTTDIEEYIKNIFGDIEVKAQFYHSQLYISINDPQFRKYKLQIFDIMGNAVKEFELSSGVGTLYVPYDISDLTSGAYLYMISCQGVVVKTGKIVSIRN